MGQLEIRKDGSVWRIAQRRKCRWSGSVTITPITPHRVDETISGGYRIVKVMLDWKQVSVVAQRLVWYHFNGEIPTGLTVNHKDGVKKDNNPSNLELATYSEQMKHAYRLGLKSEHGEKNPVKLTNLQVANIRNIYATNKGMTQAELANHYGVTFQAISRIVRGSSRKQQRGVTMDYSNRKNNPNRVRNHLGQYI